MDYSYASSGDVIHPQLRCGSGFEIKSESSSIFILSLTLARSDQLKCRQLLKDSNNMKLLKLRRKECDRAELTLICIMHSVHFMSSVLTTKEIDELTLIQVIITPNNASEELIELLCGLLEKDPAMRLGTQQLQGAVQSEEQLIVNTWCSSSGYPDGNPGNTQLMPDTQNGCARLRGLDNEPSSPFSHLLFY
ncbi:hypothetical protein EMCRGX_G002718 [Ephydatia muelleri]